MIRVVKLENYYREDRYSSQLARTIAYSLVIPPTARKYYDWLSRITNRDLKNIALQKLCPRPKNLREVLLVDFSILVTSPTEVDEKLRTEIASYLVSGDIYDG